VSPLVTHSRGAGKSFSICKRRSEAPTLPRQANCSLFGHAAAVKWVRLNLPRLARRGGRRILDGLDPLAYSQFLLERIAEHSINRIHEPLPWNVAPLEPAISLTMASSKAASE
jgi:hypothetical protein